jgi:hypothetical protein
LYTLLLLTAASPNFTDPQVLARFPVLERERAAEIRLVEAMEKRIAARMKTIVDIPGEEAGHEAEVLTLRAAKVAAVRRQIDDKYAAAWKQVCKEWLEISR